MHSTTKLACLAALLLGLAAVPATAQENEARDDLYEHLRDIQVAVEEIDNRAMELTLHPIDGSVMVWKSHTYEVNRIEERVDEIGELVPKLQNNAAVKPWQGEIIDDISGLIKAMAAQTDKVIDWLENNHMELDMVASSYQARLAGINQYAQHIDDLIDYVHERDEARERPTE